MAHGELATGRRRAFGITVMALAVIAGGCAGGGGSEGSKGSGSGAKQASARAIVSPKTRRALYTTRIGRGTAENKTRVRARTALSALPTPLRKEKARATERGARRPFERKARDGGHRRIAQSADKAKPSAAG